MCEAPGEPKALNPHTRLVLSWRAQEDIIPFFATVKLSDASDNVVKAYRELAGLVRASLCRRVCDGAGPHPSRALLFC